jgi:Domain of unknown function (DUF4281)
MSLDQLFSLGNGLAMTGWVGLLIGAFANPARVWAMRWAGLMIPAVLGIAYVTLIYLGRASFMEGGDFSSIAGVRALFGDDAALVAGWFHYLAFDLFVGAWIVREGRGANINGLLLVPCLLLTFMFGPAGLVLFFAIRLAARALAKKAV